MFRPVFLLMVRGGGSLTSKLTQSKASTGVSSTAKVKVMATSVGRTDGHELGVLTSPV